MSDDARVILVVTDDPSLSALISEPLLRTGAQEIRFAQGHDAVDLARELLPAMVLVHAQPGCLDDAWDCFHMLQSDEVARTIPALLYAPPQEVLLERSVGEPLVSAPGRQRAAPPGPLPARHSARLGASAPSPRASYSLREQGLPLGRDDL